MTAVLAQRLFEQGAVTYIRTDSVNFGDEAVEEIRDFAGRMGFSLPECPRRFAERQSSQGAHEAIRPTHIDIDVAGQTDEERALYRLIRERTIASQLTSAQYRAVTLLLEAVDEDTPFLFRARGRSLIDQGWRVISRVDAVDEDPGRRVAVQGPVPSLEVGSRIQADGGKVVERHTTASRRYTKASLIGKLEEEGIGRPATYPSIMKTIMARGYVVERERFLRPTQVGESVVDALIKAQFGFMDVAYTRKLEEMFDAIAEGRAGYRDTLAIAYDHLHDEIERFSSGPGARPRFPCPNCGSSLHRHEHPDRGTYWHCSNTSCDHYMDDCEGRPIERASYPCPQCSSPLRRYRRKDGSGYVWACPTKDCHTFLDDEDGHPVAGKSAPCPQCGRPMHRRKDRNGTGFWWGCDGYREGCSYTAEDRDGEPAPSGSRGRGQPRGLPATRRRPSRR